MNLTKANVASIVDRHYTIEQHGEKVIRPDRLDELQAVLFNQFKNVGCSIESGLGGEKLVVSGAGRTGIRKVFERRIGYDGLAEKTISIKYNDTPWHIKELTKIFHTSIEKYGIEVFLDKKKSVAYCADLFSEFPDEYRVIKMLFNEGIYEVLGDIPYETKQEVTNASYRLSVFIDKFGLSNGIKKNSIDLFTKAFTSQELLKPKRKKINLKQRAEEVGKVCYVSIENSGNKNYAAFEIQGHGKDGSGLFDKIGLGKYIRVLNQTTDAYQLAKKVEQNFVGCMSVRDIDYTLEYANITGSDLPNEVTIPTLISLISICSDKTVKSGLLVLGHMNDDGSISKVDDLLEALRVCESCNATEVLLPIQSATDLACIPTELLGKFALQFYGNPQEAVEKALK